MTDTTKPSSALPLWLWGIACLTVIGTIIAGLYTTGGPTLERMRNLDSRREKDLSQIKSEIEIWLENEKNPVLPTSLKEMKVTTTLTDPASAKPYLYRKTSETTYQLCSSFSRDSRRDKPEYFDPGTEDFHKHPDGFYCFSFNMAPKRKKCSDN